MPIIRPQSSFTFDSSWHEVVDNESPGTNLFTAKDASATLVGDVEWTETYDAILQILGYHYSDGTNFIQRTDPVRHPYYNWLHATRILSVQPRKFMGREELAKPWAIPAEARYDHCRLTVEFTPLPYRTLATSIYEYDRYVTVHVKQKAEYLGLMAGQFKYAEGAPLSSGKVFPGEVNFLESKVTYDLTWHLVPEDFISDPSLAVPFYNKIFAGVGKVNENTFLGCAPGTLLMLEPEVNRYPAPFAQTDEDGNVDPNPYWMCDVHIPLVYFNPPLGVNPGYIQAGHNNKPYFQSVMPLNYFYVSHNGAADGVTIYGSYAMANMFTHWNS